MSVSNKLPLKRFAKGSILLQSAHVSTLPASPGSLSAFQLVSSLLRKAEGGLSTCCEINHFEKRCENTKDLREDAPGLRQVYEAHKRRGEVEARVLEGE